MEKVKVSKEIFDCLESYSSFFKNSDFEINCQIQMKKDWSQETLGALNKLDFTDFVKCLLIGYECEKTKEEILSEHYVDLKNILEMSQSKETALKCKYKMKGIEYVSSLFEIELEKQKTPKIN